LTAHKTVRNAARHSRFKHVAQKITLTETSVAVLGKRRMIGHWIRKIKAAEPAVGKVEMNLFAKPAF
jgi:hypothetical protein